MKECSRLGKMRGPYKKNHRPCWIENHVCHIPLAGGKIAICDEDRYDDVKEYNWYEKDYKWGYPETHIGNRKHISLHNLLYPEIPLLDHINRDPLDNRSCNLRPANASQNARNTRKKSTNTSGYKGVSKWKHKWQASIRENNVQKYLGLFSTAEQAAKKYDEHALRVFGDFAFLNFPE